MSVVAAELARGEAAGVQELTRPEEVVSRLARQKRAPNQRIAAAPESTILMCATATIIFVASADMRSRVVALI